LAPLHGIRVIGWKSASCTAARDPTASIQRPGFKNRAVSRRCYRVSPHRTALKGSGSHSAPWIYWLQKLALGESSHDPASICAAQRRLYRMGDIINLTLLVECIGRSSLGIAIVCHQNGIERLRARVGGSGGNPHPARIHRHVWRRGGRAGHLRAMWPPSHGTRDHLRCHGSRHKGTNRLHVDSIAFTVPQVRRSDGAGARWLSGDLVMLNNPQPRFPCAEIRSIFRAAA